MAIQRVQDVALSQIPDLDSRVRARAQQKTAIRVESYLVDAIRCSIIVLDRLLASNVENFDDFVGAASRDAGTIRVELDRLHTLVVIVEDADVGLSGYIPHLDSVVFRSGCDQASIGRKLCSVDPVGVRANCEHESSILQLEYLQVLVIRAGKQKCAILTQSDRLDRCRVRLDNLREALYTVRPNANGLICRA